MGHRPQKVRKKTISQIPFELEKNKKKELSFFVFCACYYRYCSSAIWCFFTFWCVGTSLLRLHEWKTHFQLSSAHNQIPYSCSFCIAISLSRCARIDRLPNANISREFVVIDCKIGKRLFSIFIEYIGLQFVYRVFLSVRRIKNNKQQKDVSL